MYKPVQKKSSSWTPASIQNKSKSKSKPGTFFVQPKSESKSSQQQETPDYSSRAADALAANVMRSLETPQQEQEQAHSVQRQIEPGAAFVVDSVKPITPSSTSSIQSKDVGIQRQCSECAKEQQQESAEEGKDVDEKSLWASAIQTKLTVGAAGDKYEQEADRVAAQVMSMSVAPDSSPQVQRFREEDNPLQKWSLAQSITPVAQRQVDEQVQLREIVQRAFQPGGTQASGDLESRLNASKGGGSALAPEVRAFMEPRFGADFSSVRVHTGSEAVQMNRELGAQAFAHGSDVYFGAGKSPGNNELTAHELTHVVQQTGAADKSSEQKLHSATNMVSKNAESGSEADRVAKLKADYNASVKQENWANAALLLNGFNDSDILSRLKKLNGDQLAQMKRGALSSMPGWSDRITKPIDTLVGKFNPEAARVAKLKADYDAAVKQGDWGNAALLLNGFNDSDILSRLKKLSNDQLVQMKQGALSSMPGWSARVTKPIDILIAKLKPEALRVTQLNDKYYEAVRLGEWENAALLLNGFNDDDIRTKLTELFHRDPASLEALKNGALKSMPGWSDRVVKPLEAIEGINLNAAGDRDALGTTVIADVVRLQQQGADIETVRSAAFNKLKLLLQSDSAGVKLTDKDRETAVTTIAAAMAGVKTVEPTMLNEGKVAHTEIGQYYASLNKPTLVDPSLIAVIQALNLSKAAYDKLYARLPEELLESLKLRPDILDLGKMQVYEIKSFGSASRAVPEMLDYIELLESFKIPGVPASNFQFHPGSPQNPGTRGFLQSPEGGWIVFCCPVPGAIIYRTIFQMENPRSAQERLEGELQGTSNMMMGVEGLTGISIMLVMSFEELIPLLIDAAKMAGQKIPELGMGQPIPAQ